MRPGRWKKHKSESGPKLVLSDQDKIYIRKTPKSKRDPETIANYIGKPIKLVREYIELIESRRQTDQQEESEIIREIRRILKLKPEYKNLRMKLSDREIRYFEYQYCRLYQQFRGDILPTEDMQIFNLIEQSILMDRNLKEQKKLENTIEELEGQIKAIEATVGNLSELDENLSNLVASINQRINVAQSLYESKIGAYVRLEQRYSQLMKDVKGTREQRIKNIESSKETFLGLMKSLQDADFRDSIGREMELMKLATNKEYERLTQAHQYVDGTVDYPILNADVTETLDEENTDS